MDLDDILHKDPVTVDPQAGQLLISGPMLADPNFSRSAVMVIDREPGSGHLGLVLNRMTDVTLDECMTGWQGSESIPLFIGGPVELDRLFVLHRLGNEIEGSVMIAPGIYTGGNLDRLREYIASGAPTDGLIRFYLGYAGWGEEQLASEIMQNSWAVNVAPDPQDMLRDNGEAFWRREVGKLGSDYRTWLNMPGHPSLN